MRTAQAISAAACAALVCHSSLIILILRRRDMSAHRSGFQPFLELRRRGALLSLEPCQLRCLLLADCLGRLRRAQLVPQVLQLAVRIGRRL